MAFENALFLLVIAPEFYQPLRTLGARFHAGADAAAAADRIFDVLAAPLPPHRRDAPAPTRMAIRFDGVAFAYDGGERPALDGLTLEIGDGKRVALVGSSGAGKSTLASLLVRLREYEAGSILVGGVDLRTLPLEETRRIFAVMDQRTHLFNTTLRENIRLARVEAGDDAVEQAARAAAIHEFIVSLPRGYDTMAGENGVKLSGGERQRLALARLLLRDAPILVLDEPTAHLDARTEQEVMQAVLDAGTGRTIILFSHNPALFGMVDRVVRLPHVHRQA